MFASVWIQYTPWTRNTLNPMKSLKTCSLTFNVTPMSVFGIQHYKLKDLILQSRDSYLPLSQLSSSFTTAVKQAQITTDFPQPPAKFVAAATDLPWLVLRFSLQIVLQLVQYAPRWHHAALNLNFVKNILGAKVSDSWLASAVSWLWTYLGFAKQWLGTTCGLLWQMWRNSSLEYCIP